MPTLPIYNQQQNVSPVQTSPLRNPDPLRNDASQPFEDDQKVLNTLGQVAQKLSDANDVMQYTEAKAKHGIAIADIQARAAADPDFKNTDKYKAELAKANASASSGISNQMVASRASMEFEQDSMIAGIKIGAQFHDKQLAYNKVMVKQSLDTMIQGKLNATTPAEAAQYDVKINNLLAENLQTGTINYEEAEKLLTNSQETAVKYEVYSDTSTQEKDSALLKELKKPNGKYSFLDPDTRLKMIEESQRRIFQNNQTLKREAEVNRDGNFNDIFTKANEGTLTLNDLDAQMAIPEEVGGIPKKQLLEIRKGLQTRIKNDLETIVDSQPKAAEYLEFVDNFIANETDRQKGREAIVTAYKDGILSPKEATFLNKLKKETEDIKNLRSREDFMTNSLVPFKNGINAINDWFTGKKNFTESEKALAIKQMLSMSASGADPYDVSQQIIKQTTVNKNPNILNLSPEGQLTIDENGYVKVMNNKAEQRDENAKAPKPTEKK